MTHLPPFGNTSTLPPFARRLLVRLIALWTGVLFFWVVVHGQEFVLRHVHLEPAIAQGEFQRHPDWIRVSRQELEKLLQTVQERAQHRTRSPILIEAQYQARWQDNALLGKSQWRVWAEDGHNAWLSWQPFSLALRPPVRINGRQADVGIASGGELGTELTKSTAPDDRSASSASAEYQVEWEWSASLERRGNEQVASLVVPPAQLATLQLEAPARFRISLRGAEASLFKTTAVAGKPDWLSYQWALAPNTTRLELVFRESVHEARAPRLHVHQQAQYVFDHSGWQCSYLLGLEAPDAPLSVVRVVLARGTQIQTVQERLHGLPAHVWSVEVNPEATVVTVRFAGTERRAELEIVCRSRPLPAADMPIAFTLAQVPGATVHVATLLIRWRQGLVPGSWSFGDFHPQQPPQLGRDGFWQLSLEQTTPGLLGPSVPPRATVRPKTADVTVQAELHCHLGLQDSRVLAYLTWNVRSGSLFRLGVRLPAGWLVEDGQVAVGDSSVECIWRREGDRLWAEWQQGTLQAPASARMSLRLRSAKPQPDFARAGDWPLPEIIPELATWAQATWYMYLERLSDEQGRRRPIAVLWPGQPWKLQPSVSSGTDTAKPSPDYVFTGPLPCKARLRVQPMPVLCRLTLHTDLQVSTNPTTSPSTHWPRRLHVRWSVQVEPVSGLLTSARVRFPGEVPELDWRVVAGDCLVRRVERRFINVGQNEDKHTETIFEWFFDKPLTAPVRMEADWLYPCPPLQPTGSASPSLCTIPLPGGETHDWWVGRLASLSSLPPSWELLLQTVSGSATNSPVKLTALPFTYSEPAYLQVRTLELTWPSLVLDGALLGITWDGQQQLRCDYWAWANLPEPVHDSSVATPGELRLSLQLPPGALLQETSSWRGSGDTAVPIGREEAQNENHRVAFVARPPGPVVFHVRYTVPVRTLLCWACWPALTPTWDESVTLLGQRIWVCLPQAWVPFTRQGKIRYGSELEGHALEALESETAKPARAVIVRWLGQNSSSASISTNEPNTWPVAKLSYSGFVWWEFTQTQDEAEEIWVRLDQAHALAATVALGVFWLGSTLMRWAPRIALAGLAVILLVSGLGLIWLPEELASFIYWPVGAFGLLLWRYIRASTSLPRTPNSQADPSHWFTAASAIRLACWIVMLLCLLGVSWRVMRVSADELGEAADKPVTTAEKKEVPTVTLFHYTEGQGDSARHWVLVPLVWWQRWQQMAQAPPIQPDWLITSSRWYLDAHKVAPPSPQQAGSVASVTWELEVTLRGQEAALPLAVSGIRWRSAAEVKGTQNRALDITPLEEPKGVLLRLQGPGKHSLRLVGDVDIQQTGQECRLSWNIPPMPFATLHATLPGNAERVECLGVRGQVRQTLLANPTASTGRVWQCQAELGPVAEVRLCWYWPDLQPTQWRVEEFHWLVVRRQDVVWNTVCRLAITQGQLNEVRLAIPDAFLVRSVEARQENGTAVGLASWQVQPSVAGKVLVIQFASPVSGTCLVLVEHVVQTEVAFIWHPWQKAQTALIAVAPHSTVPGILRGWPIAGLEKHYLRQLTLVLPAPYTLGQAGRRDAWLGWQAEDSIAVRITPRGLAKPLPPNSNILQKIWPTHLLPLTQLTQKPPFSWPATPRFWQLMDRAARLQVQIAPAPPQWTVRNTLHLEADWHQVHMLLRAELQAEGGSLPATVLVQLSNGWRITDVLGESVTDWQQEGSQLRIWLRPGRTCSLQIRATTSLEGSADSRTFAVPTVHFPSWRTLSSRVELVAASGLRLLVVKSQGLNLLNHSDNKASLEIVSPSYNGVVQLRSIPPRFTAQMTSVLRRGSHWWWETQIECRTTKGTIPNLEVHIQHWSGEPPRVISEELHHAQVQPRPDGQGYLVRVDFPEAASLADQTVRFRILGRLTFSSEPAPLPIFHLPEAQTARHRLTAWPAHVVIANAVADGDAWRLPTEVNASPATLRFTGADVSPVRVVFAQADVWHIGSAEKLVQLSCWLVHPPYTYVQLRMPTSATLIQVTVQRQPISWHVENDQFVRIPLLKPTGFSVLRLVWRCSALDADQPWPELEGQPLRSVWVQRWYPLSGDEQAGDMQAAHLRSQMAWLEAAITVLRQELPAISTENAEAFAQLAWLVDTLLQTNPRSLSPETAKRWQSWQRQWSELTASPRLEPVRRILAQMRAAQSSQLGPVSAPFLAAHPLGQIWSVDQPWTIDLPAKESWQKWAQAVLASTILAALVLITLLIFLFPLGRLWLSRFAPESLLAVAVFWGVFLEPRWAAAWLVGLGLYWRYRRWRSHHALLHSQAYLLTPSQ